MSTLRSDPLLRGTRLLIVIVQALAGMAGAVLALAIPAIWLLRDKMTIVILDEAAHRPDGQALALITFGILCGIAIAALAFLFLRNLVAVIDTVDGGSPFIPVNARRLRAMGWLALAMQGVALALKPVAGLLRDAASQHSLSISFDLGGLLVALLLFILARVFDHGTRLQEDIEGTV